jgi:hypothetical protein
MKQISQSIINSTNSLLGRWTKVTTMGCILALVFLGATSAQPKASGTARPFKATGIVTGGSATSIDILGTATHLGKFVSSGSFEITGFSDDGLMVFLHVWGSFTAANGDTLEIDFPKWVADYSVDPPTSSGVAYFKGGTGRFVNASGSYVASFSPADAAPGVTQIYTAEGTISY